MITPQSANWTTMAQKAGKGMQLLAYIEGIADPVCTVAPADARTKAQAVDFDGTNDHIDCGTNTALTQLADWTVLAWIKPDTLTNGVIYTICGEWDSAGEQGFRVALTVSGGVGSLIVKFTGGDVGGYTLAGATVSANAWTFVALSLGGNGKTILRGMIGSTSLTDQYIAITRATRNVFTAGQAFQIAHAQGASYFNGRIGLVQVFNRALTPDEMRRVKFRRLTVAWGDDDSGGLWNDLVGQWSLERGSGTNAINDKLGGTHDGTLTNGPTWTADACYSATYRPSLFAEATTEQSIDPLGTRTSISATTLRILDTAEWFTAQLDTLAMALPGKRVDLFMGFHGLLESEYQRVFIGRIRDSSYDVKAYTIRVGDGLLDAKKRVQLGRATIVDAMTNAAGQDANVAVGTYWSDSATRDTFAKIDDEIIESTADAGSSATKFTIDAGVRGVGTSDAAAHSAGAVISEIWVPAAALASQTLLRNMLSGAGFEASDLFDWQTEFTYTDATTKVTRGRGMGLSPSDVSIDDIDNLTALGVNGCELFVTDDVDDLKDLCEREILRPFGCYFFSRSDGRISVASPAIPSASVYDLDPTRTYRFEWSVSYDDLVNWLAIEYDYDIGSGDFLGQAFYTDATAAAKYGLKKREYSFKGVGSTCTPATTLDALKDLILDRFKNPYRTLTLTCGFYEMLLEIGDCVSLTNLNLPNVATGTLGVHEKLWQIIGRQVDFRTGRVRLTLADVSDM